MIWYNTRNLTFQEKKEIISKAKEVCYNWWVDILDGTLRKSINMSFEEIVTKFDKHCHFTIIHRNNDPENYLEIAFSTMDGQPDYFLWIHLEPKHIPEFTKGCQ